MNDTKIQLTQGKFTMIDEEDVSKLGKKKWCAHLIRNTFYACADGGKTLLHRVILNAQPDEHIDHINGDGLDNRKVNLRIATIQQNAQNSRKQKSYKNKPTSSKYKGVTWASDKRKWKAQISINEKPTSIGYYDQEIDAAKAYDKKAIELRGTFARINEFIPDYWRKHGQGPPG